MSEQPNELKPILEEILKLVTETQDKVSSSLDEILEAVELTEKNLTRQIAELDAYQRKILEPNQQILNNGLEKIHEVVAGIKESQESAEEPAEEAQE